MEFELWRNGMAIPLRYTTKHLRLPVPIFPFRCSCPTCNSVKLFTNLLLDARVPGTRSVYFCSNSVHVYVLDHIEYEPRQSVPDRLRTGRQEVDDDVVQVEQTPLPREARGGTTRPPVRQVRVYKVARRALDESPLVLFPNDETKNVLEKLRPLIIRLYYTFTILREIRRKSKISRNTRANGSVFGTHVGIPIA